MGAVSEVGRVAVIGSGTMGGGVATLLLMNGYTVDLFDLYQSSLDKARTRVAKRSDERTVADRLVVTTDLQAAVANADFVIEAVPEILELKRQVFSRLDMYAPEHAVLATNTSELSVTAIAGASKRPEQVVGMHWFNPPERIALIEVVRAVRTDTETLERTVALAESCGQDHRGSRGPTGVRLDQSAGRAAPRGHADVGRGGGERTRHRHHPPPRPQPPDGSVRTGRLHRSRTPCCSSRSRCRTPSASGFYHHRRCAVWSRQDVWAVSPGTDSTSMTRRAELARTPLHNELQRA